MSIEIGPIVLCFSEYLFSFMLVIGLVSVRDQRVVSTWFAPTRRTPLPRLRNSDTRPSFPGSKQDRERIFFSQLNPRKSGGMAGPFLSG